MTALTGATLAKKNIVNLTNLQGSVPSLSILVGSPAGSGYAIVSIRGQAQYNNNIAGDPAVGIYVDGVYISRPSASTLDLLDVDHVEVLRGPQGTLFGRNTVGGAVTIATKQPNGEFGGMISAEAGNYSENRETAVLNVPIVGDQLDLRMDYVHAEHGGYGRDITLNRPAGDLHENFGRAQLRFAPTSAHWNLTLEGDWFANDDSGQQVVLRAVNVAKRGHALDSYLQTNANFYNDFGGSIALFEGGFRLPYDHQYAQGYSARFNADFGWAKFKSITAYHANVSNASIDLDGTPVNVLENSTFNNAHNFSQEFQLNGNVGKLDWITGFYYFQEAGRNLGYARNFGFIKPSAPQAELGRSLSSVINKSTAAYAQVYYKFTDKLRGYAGVRYTWDERIANVSNGNAAYLASNFTVFTGNPAIDNAQICSSLANPALPPNPTTNPCYHHSDAKFAYPSYSMGFDYQAAPNIFLYTSFNTAYMSGFQNVRVATVPAVKPEGDKAVEVGIKSDWLDHRLRVNADVFHTWQTNVQRQVNTVVCPPCISTAFSINAGNAQVTGAEFEVTALPWKGMELTGGLGLMSGGYDKGTFLDTQTIAAATNPNPGPCIPAPSPPNPAGQFFCTFDRSGEALPQFPKLTFNIGATQKVPLSFGELTLHMDYAYISSQHYVGNTAAPEQPPAIAAQYAAAQIANTLPAHGELNALATLDIANTGIQLALWGKNITGTKYLADNFDSYIGLGIVNAEPGAPTTFGGTITYRFGHQ